MQRQIKVLIVDDSVLIRRLIARALEAEKDFKVAGNAANGQEALSLVRSLRPDVVTMDVEMPVMDGLEALRRLMRESPVPVVMLSAHTTEGARVTMEALSAGAVDFVAKPSRSAETGVMMAELVSKLRVAARASVTRLPGPVLRPRPPQTGAAPVPAAGQRADLVVIGSSTGGPSALHKLLPALPKNLRAGVVVVQHIPVGFSGPMAEHLNRNSALAVKHAANGDQVQPGQALVAPAGSDLVFRRSGSGAVIQLLPGASPLPPGSFRPSVDGVMISAAAVYGNRVLGVLLTGMGRDGAAGMSEIKAVRGRTIAEDQSTCVVFGMPKAAIDAGAADIVLPLQKIAEEIIRQV
ncbi:MAG: chemotaxis response regulator protein-glutamate methylesterase [Bacillota bacterium]|jgi:two-component system chemotaxis response regulator CheB